jgi:predicted membrane-bound mannosyltransferase
VSARGNLAPVPSESPTCANCSAPLVADQRYCLACGQPVSPVRLAFLDVLQSERQQQTLTTTPVGYGPLLEPSGSPAWLRRYTPLFAVMSVLLLALIVGLLVGHWVTQSKSSAPAQQVIKVEGLGAAPAAAATSTAPASTSTTPAASSSAAAKSSPKSEAEEVAKEAKAEKQQAAKVEHATVVKPSSTKLKKLGNSTGKKHEEEVNALGEQPIETGG